MLKTCWKHCITIPTRQSEMANTSPRHMPVLGNAHPIQIENFFVISLLARVFIFVIDRATQEVPMKNIVLYCRSSFWDIHHWMFRLDVCWRGLMSLTCTYVAFLSGMHWPTRSICMHKFVMIHWILQKSWARKYHYSLAWDTLLTPEISKYRPFTC